jgi:hypothetical protein
VLSVSFHLICQSITASSFGNSLFFHIKDAPVFKGLKSPEFVSCFGNLISHVIIVAELMELQPLPLLFISLGQLVFLYGFSLELSEYNKKT